jgi:ABC-type lipoprotein release transport system permease subunit
VSQIDPLTLAGVCTVLLLAAFAACYVPARRAMRTEPMQCLRLE